MDHFKRLLRARGDTSIAEIVQIVQLFPLFMDEEENEELMDEVSKGELL